MKRLLVLLSVLLLGAVAAVSISAPATASGDYPTAPWHYAANGNFDDSGNYLPGADGFNLADVASREQLDSLPAGVKGLAWVGMCDGVTPAFTDVVDQYLGDAKLYGFYLMDRPDPTGQWYPVCTPEHLKAEADYIYDKFGWWTITFIIVMNMSSSAQHPSYADTYTYANSHVDLFGIDPYPCRTDLAGCDYSYITKAVAAAEDAGIPQWRIVPVFQTFGGGNWTDDAGSTYAMPDVAQERQLLATWQSVVPTPKFDYPYSWGRQRNDTALSGSQDLEDLFATKNAGQ
jgi:hypothetical protein